MQWVLVVVLAFSVGAPVLVKLNIWADPAGIQAVEEPDVPESSALAFAELRLRLEPLGYRSVGWLRSDTTPGSRTFVGAMVHDELRSSAAVLDVFTPKTGADGTETLEPSQTMIELFSVLEDGRRVSTSNNRWPKSFEAHDGLLESRHPDVRDAGRLHGIHLGERRRAGSPPRPFGEDPVTSAREQFHFQMASQVEAGLFHADGDGIYRPTWKGAFLMTYRQLFDVLLGRDDEE